MRKAKGKSYVKPKEKLLNNRQKREVKRIAGIGREIKYSQAYAAVGSIDVTAPSITKVTNIAQGDTDITRDGDQCYIKEVFVNYFITLDTAIVNTHPGGAVRIALVQWKPNTTPTATQIWISDPSGAVTPQSRYSIDNHQLFRVLYDKTFVLNGYANGGVMTNTSANGCVISSPKVVISPKKYAKVMQFSGGTTTGTNQLYWLAVGTLPNPQGPAANLNCYIRFADM